MQPPNVLYINKIGGKRLFTAEKWLSQRTATFLYNRTRPPNFSEVKRGYL